MAAVFLRFGVCLHGQTYPFILAVLGGLFYGYQYFWTTNFLHDWSL